MQTGKIIKIIELPKPVRSPLRKKDNDAIPVPNWPVKKPVEVPQDA